MKTTRKLIAMAAALTLAACAAAPVFTYAADSSSVTITGTYATEHTFEIYQIMTGEYDSVNNKFTKLKWGADVQEYEEATITVGNDVTDAQLTAISGISDAGTLPSSLILKSSGRKYSDKAGANNVSFSGLEEGYYIIKDVTALDGKDDSNSAWIVQVAGTTSIAIKNAKPTFDKTVQDEKADAETSSDTDGYGESADHAINEKFNFKLTATIPNDSDLKEYSTYELKFHDSLSKGLTFDQIKSVKVGTTTLTAAQYIETATAAIDKNGLSWDLTINNVRSIAEPSWGTAEITVEVIYEAHLNENADVRKASVTKGTTNKNTAYLEYSNNPDNLGTGPSTGKTTPDNVWVFTYGVDNTKYKINDSDGNQLAGAKFQIKNGTSIIKLIDNGNGTYTVADQSAELAAATETTKAIVDTMTSSSDGIFNIIGLDAGTYTLVETVAPDGYNVAADTSITITGTHSENAAGTEVSLDFGGVNLVNKIVDTKNSELPTTGGTGTKLLYLAGGICAIGGGMVLVSKKRVKI